MLTTSGCRAQSTVWRRRFSRSALGGLAGLLGIFLFAAPGQGRAEPLVAWAGPVQPLSLVTLDGTSLHLEKLRGQLVIVHYFATWCEPCGPELTAIDRLKRDLGDRLTIVAVDVGEPGDRVRRFLQKHAVGLPVALDPEQHTTRAWGVYALPATFILDPSLAPRWQAIGEIAWDSAPVRRLLAEAMQDSPTAQRPD